MNQSDLADDSNLDYKHILIYNHLAFGKIINWRKAMPISQGGCKVCQYRVK